MKRQPKNTLRSVAIHEAGHAVASHIVQRELGRHWNAFHRVFIRTIEEAKTPYIDDRGRHVDCIGMMEGPSRYNPTGLCIFDLGFGEGVDRAEFIAMSKRAMEADVVEYLAGPIAEARARRISQTTAMFYLGGAADYDRSTTIAREFCRSEPELDTLIDVLWARAGKLVHDAGNWRAINALADELIVRRSLSADEAVAVITAAG